MDVEYNLYEDDKSVHRKLFESNGIGIVSLLLNDHPNHKIYDKCQTIAEKLHFWENEYNTELEIVDRPMDWSPPSNSSGQINSSGVPKQ